MSYDGYFAIAGAYDSINSEIDYSAWADFFEKCFEKYSEKKPEIVLDLACGTGRMTAEMSKRGYDMIGVDGSIDMLSEAYSKDTQGILYLCQDMREFELYGTVAAVVSICDCMNYITEQEDLVTVFKLVNNYLDPEGIFIFDLNTEYKYETVMGDCTIAEDREDSSFIWENQYEKDEKINIYDVSIFVKETEDLYRKYHETHYQRAYTLDEVQQALKEAGMEFVAAYDAFTKEPPKANSERIYVVAKEHGKSANSGDDKK